MGATVTPIQGRLAGIFRTPGELVGAVSKHQLLLNPTFEVGALTSWTDDTAGTATVTATAAKGWMDRSWGVVMDDKGDGLCGISQIVTLDAAISEAEALSYRIHASVWTKFDEASKTAVLKITGSSTGSLKTVNAVPTAAGTGYVVDEVLTISTGSGDATVKVTGETAGVIDTVVFVSAGTGGYSVAAGQATTASASGINATIEITAVEDKVLGTATVTMLSEHPYYDSEAAGFGIDGYFSVDMAALEYMEKITVEVYSDLNPATSVWNIDNVQAYILDEVAGAYGDMALDQNTLLENISTYATIGSNGEHVFAVAGEEPSMLEIPSFYVTSETFAVNMKDGDKLFVILYTKRGTKTAARWEFFAYVKSVGINVPGKSFLKENVSLQVTGIVGFADR